MSRRFPRRPSMETLERRITLTAAVGPVMHESVWEQVIVAFRDDVRNPRATAEGVINPTGGRLGHIYENSISGFSAQLPAAAVRGLVHHPHVRSVEIDMLMSAHGQSIPSGVSRIGALTNTVGGTIGGGKSLEGEEYNDVQIAIIDSGIAAHPDLNVVGGARFYTVTGGPPRNRGSIVDDRYADDSGHGTHVAGTAAARDNGSGVVGVAPGARLWAVKVLDSSGNGFMSDIIAGVDWVTERADTISVANMSLGGTGRSDALRAAIQASVNAGIVYTVSAGNGWEDIHGLSKTFNTTDDVIPAAYPEVATIAAFADSDGQPGGLGPATSWGQYGQDDAWWGPSNFSNSYEAQNQHFLDANPVDSPGLGIDLILPGVDILSTYLNGGLATMSGTSMAAPHAAGLAALHIAANGRATNADEVHAIRQALIDNGPSWNDPEGLAVHWGPAAYMANIGWAGELDPVTPSDDPTVAIESPVDGAIVWGDVVVTASATVAEGASLASVDIFLGNDRLGEMGQAPDTGLWNFTWSTVDGEGQPLYADGAFQLTVLATDDEGRGASDSVSITVANVDEKPMVEIISPSAGATLSGTIEIAIEAYDDRGVDSVEVFLGNTSLGDAIDSGNHTWTLPLNSADHGDGSYDLRAVAIDSSGQFSEHVIAVTVDNSVVAANVALSGTAIRINRNFWRAQVTATVSDNNHQPLASVEVLGRWNDSSDLVSMSTNSQGQIMFESQNLRNNESAEFTVIDIPGFDYEGPVSIQISQHGTNQTILPVPVDQLEEANEGNLATTGTVTAPVIETAKRPKIAAGSMAVEPARTAPPVEVPAAAKSAAVLSPTNLDEFFLTAEF